MTASLPSEAFPGRLLGEQDRATFYFEAGPLDGQPVLFVHGFGGTARNFTLNIGPLEQAGFRVVAPELWGMGRSAKPHGRYSLDRWVDQLIGLMDSLGMQQTFVVGHSMGGAVAVRLARRCPERVAKLVLVAPLGFGAKRDVRLMRLATLPGMALIVAGLRFRRPRPEGVKLPWRRVLTPSGFSAALARYRFQPPTREELIERANWRFAGRASPEGALAWADSAHLLFQQQNMVRGLVRTGRAVVGLIGGTDQRVRKDYAELKLPTLAIWGEEDRTVPTQDSETLRALRADARLEVYAQCGHHPYLEATDQFNEMLIAFLGSHETS
ncbi:MAG TPA: alpha/beta fold hydrolase [Ktedonobacterales bacterium]|jgi:4,5:9,10-diseco-3-hydroxy-5,9,17-trioxoandrosta-1(10),2-diene-4-oate hydrolase